MYYVQYTIYYVQYTNYVYNIQYTMYKIGDKIKKIMQDTIY